MPWGNIHLQVKGWNKLMCFSREERFKKPSQQNLHYYIDPMRNLLRKILFKIDHSFKYKKNSYAQYGEDILIYSLFKEFLKIDKPSYLDIGAHHPYHLSNSALLYKLGSRGVNIEANPSLIQAFHKFRPGDKNINIGISPLVNETLPFYIMYQPELNTFIKDQAEELEGNGYPIKEIINIPCYNLEYIIQNYCDGIFPDFLSLDVEGFDVSVIENYGFRSSKPKIICVENLKIDKNGRFYKLEKIREVLRNNNYVLIADTFLNDIFADGAHIDYQPGSLTK
jgi:hypothetical protein